MKEKELRDKLSVLGKERSLDILLYIAENDWTTATEIANALNIHIATAVKHLQDMEEIEILVSRARKGKTRSAQEYSLVKSRVILEIDLESLRTEPKDVHGNSDTTMAFISEFILRLSKLTGKDAGNIIQTWRGINIEEDSVDQFFTQIEASLGGGSTSVDGVSTNRYSDPDVLAVIEEIIDHEEKALGPFSLRSLLKISFNHLSKDMREIEGSRVYQFLDQKYHLSEVSI